MIDGKDSNLHVPESLSSSETQLGPWVEENTADLISRMESHALTEGELKNRLTALLTRLESVSATKRLAYIAIVLTLIFLETGLIISSNSNTNILDHNLLVEALPDHAERFSFVLQAILSRMEKYADRTTFIINFLDKKSDSNMSLLDRKMRISTASLPQLIRHVPPSHFGEKFTPSTWEVVPSFSGGQTIELKGSPAQRVKMLQNIYPLNDPLPSDLKSGDLSLTEAVDLFDGIYLSVNEVEIQNSSLKQLAARTLFPDLNIQDNLPMDQVYCSVQRQSNEKDGTPRFTLNCVIQGESTVPNQSLQTGFDFNVTAEGKPSLKQGRPNRDVLLSMLQEIWSQDPDVFKIFSLETEFSGLLSS